MSEPTPPPAAEPVGNHSEPVEKISLSTEPPDRFQDPDLPLDEIQAEVERLQTANRELVARVPDVRQGGDMDWVGSELNLRIGLLIEHALGDGTRRRLLYELAVMRQFHDSALNALVKREQILAAQEADVRRRKLLEGVAGTAVPPGALPDGFQPRRP